MAILFLDGCDLWDASGSAALLRKYLFAGSQTGRSVVTVLTSGGRYGGGALRMPSDNNARTDELRVLIPTAAATTIVCGAAFNFGVARSVGSPAAQPVFQLRSTMTTDQVSLVYNYGSGQFEYRRGGVAGTLVQSAVYTLNDNTWYYIELKTTINAATGTIDLQVNGVSVMSFTGQNTGSTAVQLVVMRNTPSGSATRSVDVDDIYIDDTNMHGNARVWTLAANGDTSDKDFLRSTGSDNYALVDEVPTTLDTDYVYSNVNTDFDLYNMANLSAVPANLYCVQVTMIVKKADAGNHDIRTKIKSNGTGADGTNRGALTSYGPFSTRYDTDPSGGGNWTYSRINGAQAGMEITS